MSYDTEFLICWTISPTLAIMVLSALILVSLLIYLVCQQRQDFFNKNKNFHQVNLISPKI